MDPGTGSGEKKENAIQKRIREMKEEQQRKESNSTHSKPFSFNQTQSIIENLKPSIIENPKPSIIENPKPSIIEKASPSKESNMSTPENTKLMDNASKKDIPIINSIFDTSEENIANNLIEILKIHNVPQNIHIDLVKSITSLSTLS